AHPFLNYSSSAKFKLTLFPGDTTLVQGQDVEISVQIDGDHPDNLFIYFKFIDTGTEFRKEKLTSPYLKKISSVRESFEYYVRADNMETEHFTVEVVIRPLIKNLQVQLVPPAYSRLPVNNLPNNRGDIECLKGTRAEMLIMGNKQLSEAKIDFKKKKSLDLTVDKNQGKGSFFVWQPDSYFVSIKDTSGLENSNPISYSVTIEPDYPPLINLLSPQASLDLDEEMLIPLVLDIADDYGISAVKIGYQVIESSDQDSLPENYSFIGLPVDKREPTELRVEYTWMVDTLNLFPEDIIHYFIEVADNDRISGPKKTKTPLFSARFPSMAEIFEEVSTKQEEHITQLEKVFERSDTVEKELEEISRQLKSEGELDWEEKKSVEQISKEQQDLGQKMQDLSNDLNNVIDQLEKNQMISPETLEKYEELQNLYQEIDSPELQSVLEELNKVMQDIDPEQMKKSIDNFYLAQQNFRAETSGQIRREEMIQNDTQQIKEDMSDLHKDMSELSNMPLSQMKAALDSMNREKLSERIEGMISRMQSGNITQAVQSGEMIKQSLQSLTRMMEKVNESLKNKQNQRVTKALQKSATTLLELSQGQESLQQTREKGEITKSKTAVYQTGLISGLDQVIDSLQVLSRNTLLITPQIGTALGAAKANMQQALQTMNTNNTDRISYFQSRAVGSLNQGVMSIEEILTRMQGGGFGMGMEEFLMQMQQMAGEQSRLNQETMDLLDQGSLSLAQQAAMSRLAQQQQAIKRAVEKLLQELGNEEKYSGRLDRTLEEMKKVIKDFQDENINRQTIARQQRILSRMLDLQQSLRKRDYSNNRTSVTGRDVIRTGPEAMNFEASKMEQRIQEDILRLPEEGYTKQFQKLIRAYYELLFEKSTTTPQNNDK
ncbi:MAG: hypothetical protein P8078_07895, partial [bacterium]